jgi:hypothetical protein
MAASDGTGGGLFEFFDWAESKHELPKSQVANWRGAAKNVLGIEDDYEALDLRALDLDDYLRRFEIASRTKYKSDSLNAYKGRFRKAVATYRLWLEQSPDWKGAVAPARATANGSSHSSGGAKATVVGRSRAAAAASAPPPTPGTIDHTFPLRPGVYARLSLPEDMTSWDAKRLSAFISSLAFDEQLAITSGSDAED